MLLQKTPDYDNLRVFDCLVIASNPARTHGKLAPREMPCLFSGCASNQKGYKLMNLLTKQSQQTFVSWDVNFYEHVFPYQKRSYDKYMKPIPEVKPKTNDLLYSEHLDDILYQMSNQIENVPAMGDSVSHSSEDSTPQGVITPATTILSLTGNAEQSHET